MTNEVKFDVFKDSLRPSARMPVLFLGHGSPLYAIDDNAFSQSWKRLGASLPMPQTILVVSAHWMSSGTTFIDVSRRPKTIHDFGRFPQALFDVQYPADGNPELAREVIAILKAHEVKESDEWGLDHGAWSVLRHLYPEADVPVFQLSIDMTASFEKHFEIAQSLKELRERGVLVLGSGNLVHNLREIGLNVPAHDYALEFDGLTKKWLTDRDFKALQSAPKLGSLMQMAHPTVDHYIPSLYIAALADSKDDLMFFNEVIDMGSMSMRSFIYF